MTKTDIFLLAILSGNDRFSLREIVVTMCEINFDKPPSRIALYKRLEVLKLQQMIRIEWQLGTKQYSISTKGLAVISKLTNQLIKAQL